MGRRAAVWHGDVLTGARNRIVRQPPDILLTTPESIEVMLTSARIEHSVLLGDVRSVVVDELHAFAGDDRGWHLLSLVERLRRVAGRDLQRLGLSATVGNPTALLDWFKGASEAPGQVVAPGLFPTTTTQATKDVVQDMSKAAKGAPAASATTVPAADVVLDYVGNLANAATVISRLHRGEKRLVFCDSRARVEQLAHLLREREVPTFVSHSSLSADERQQAEAAFANRRDAVIVSTSTLELGIDVGDLDRVIQIDAPSTVASFLQRLGRTGRRAGTERNCLFLATQESAFIQTTGLLELWKSGFVEPVLPPPLPYHILAQQLMALVLQEHGVGRHTWQAWFGALSAKMKVGDALTAIMDHMLETHLLHEDGGIVSFGAQGERNYGWRHFMELMTVFTSDPLICVRHGREDLGFVHPLTFAGPADRTPVLLLAGRAWAVRYVDWKRKVAHVEATDMSGRSQWLGGAAALHGELCRSARSVLSGTQPQVTLTTRASTVLSELRDSYAWAREDETSLVREGNGALRWWTFAGLRANIALRRALGDLSEDTARADNFSIRLVSTVDASQITQKLSQLELGHIDELMIVDSETVKDLKFSDCLPIGLATQLLRTRLSDRASVARCVSEPVRSTQVND